MIPILGLAILYLVTITIVIVSVARRDSLGYYYPFTLGYAISGLMLAICFLLYFFRRSAYRYAVLIFLFLGLTGFASVSVSEIRLNFLNPIFLVVGVIFILLNTKRLQQKLNGSRSAAISVPDAEKIEAFRTRFSGLNDDDLRDILKSERYVEEATIAAQQLIEERTNARS
ncbi:MAG: hypothetical protein INR69_05700 [Mucilaginibacter polytrichastri]|nr:hypothetical protein [Mucilaginibacter polytrichastri]